YQSISMQGVHAVMAIEGVNSFEKYHEAYRQLTVLFNNQIGYMLCPGANVTTQLTIMSYDPDIYINDFPVAYKYVFDKKAEEAYYLLFPRNKTRNEIDI